MSGPNLIRHNKLTLVILRVARAKPQSIGSKFFHIRSNGILEERGQVPIYVIFPPEEHKATLETLINQWSDDEQGQFLYGKPDCLVLHLQLFKLHEQQWTKHHRPLEVPANVIIPYSNDGIVVAKARYRIVAMVLHQGTSHDNGHLVAVHAIDNTYWLVDDDQFPQPTRELTDQQEREVLQLWLAHDPTDEMEEDHISEEPPPPTKKQKTHYEDIQIASPMSPPLDWVWSKADRIWFLQETHLNEKKMNEALQYFIVRGWKAHGVAAEETGKGGTTGGFLRLRPPHHHIPSSATPKKAMGGWP